MHRAPTVPLRISLVLLASLILPVSSVGQETGIGDKRDDVVRRYGKPSSTVKRGGHEIFQYPTGGRIVFIDGKVVEVKTPLPPPIAEIQEAVETPPISSTNTNEPAIPPPGGPAPEAKAAPALATADVAEMSDVSPLEKLSLELEKMEHAKEADANERETADELNVGELLVSLMLHFGITLLALRLAFKYWEMDALWTGVFAIAGIDLGSYAILEVLGPLTSGLTQMGTLQSGIGTLIMIPAIQRFCFNKQLQNAVLTAVAVKVIIQLCHMFLFVLLLNALFG